MDLSKEWYRSEFISQETIESHRELENELAFYKAVQNGDIEYIEENIRKKDFTNPKGMGKLSEDPLRNLRYHFIVTSSMIARYCTLGGMEQEKAYSMSDFYILKMDKCKTIAEIEKLHDVMCMDACRQMHTIHKSHILSKPIVLCLEYIYSHIHYRITIKELADHLSLSESYLSRLFHKEMGITVSQYITDLKIEKAKNLLQYSEYSIVEIANYLSFSSQSHFVQVFRKCTGITPHKYRSQHFRSSWELSQ